MHWVSVKVNSRHLDTGPVDTDNGQPEEVRESGHKPEITSLRLQDSWRYYDLKPKSIGVRLKLDKINTHSYRADLKYKVE